MSYIITFDSFIWIRWWTIRWWNENTALQYMNLKATVKYERNLVVVSGENVTVSAAKDQIINQMALYCT